jgi:hypothetical protein
MRPIVELDSEAHAAYVRLSRNRVARTEVINKDGCIVTIDRDKQGDPVGIELVGVDEFTLGTLLLKARAALSKKDIARVRYVPAALQAA